MKISVVQFKPEFKNPYKNYDFMIEKIKRVDSDIIVFPELVSSGYYFRSINELLPYSEKFDSENINKIAGLAENTNKIIVFGFAELHKNGRIYNSAAMLFPDPSYNKVYRKSHLFYKESDVFTQGDTGFFVVDYKPMDLKLGTMICYDWRFPEAARTLALKGADLIVCPSNLVTDVWHISMPSRALENKVYLAVANRIGTEENQGEELLFNGKSAIYSYNGSAICFASKDSEDVISAEIEPSKTRDKSFNERNDIFNDRRKELYL